MKSSLLLASFLGLMSGVKAAELDIGRMLEVLYSIEGGKANEPGGRPCISYGAWSDRTDLAYTLSMNESAATPIFKAHLTWIIGVLRQNRVKVSPEAVGCIWRFGATKAARLGYKCDYGQRCANLYADKAFIP